MPKLKKYTVMEEDKILKKSFYERPTLEVARNLLGCSLVRKKGKKIIKGYITEAEAYIGENDLACHASKGKTPRTEVMYGEAGHAYIYMIYGMYHCLNVVTEQKHFPAAVLIRGIKIEDVEYKLTNGPGKLCRFLEIDKNLNLNDLTVSRQIWIEKGIEISDKEIETSKRIGIEYAKHCAEYKWRFSIDPSKIFLET